MQIDIARYYTDLTVYLTKDKRLEKLEGVFMQKPEFEVLPYLCLGKIQLAIEEATGGSIFECEQEVNLYTLSEAKNDEIVVSLNELLEKFLTSNFELLSFRLAMLNYAPIYDGKVWQQQLSYQFSFYK